MNPSKTIDLRGGITLAYREHGERDGTPVIALHGVTDSQRSFDPVLPHLPRGLRWFSLTQRGHGESAKPAGDAYRPRDFAGDVAAFMDAMSIDRAVVVGHSMGSVNAQRFALDHRERVLGLVLAGSAPFFGRHPDMVAFWRNDIAALTDPIDPAFARDFQLSTLARPVSPEFLEMVVGESMKVPARVWRAAFDGFMSDDFSAGLRRIDAPVLVIAGRHDMFCRAEDQAALEAALPNARLVTYDDAGHAMHWEEPARFAADVAAFALISAAMQRTITV